MISVHVRGGHVRRRSIGSIIEASSCVREPRGVEKPSIASSHIFGGSVERQSLEKSVLIAEEDHLSGCIHSCLLEARPNYPPRSSACTSRSRSDTLYISRSSVYETIEEENLGSNQTSPARSVLPKKSRPITRQAIFIVDSDSASIN
ncbi:hypothetical protein CVT26_008114 [Gymnopilus dilepis]|uniref:Uncharacterized protein n=1 Tax=Gymnopilus dilepis TaxID=231916 RepID=A0A409YJR6_9AGAR|nr:hypothetical protein CVT26_008114 [Gymnopilus dilepis]